jgi:cation diffusion facilitator family transporter
MPTSDLNSQEDANYKTGQRLAIIGLVTSAGLAFIKLTGGLFTHSTSLSADGLESASDVLASAIIWGGMTIARRPPDERFPYGYGRAESLAGKTVGTILLMSAVLLATHSTHRLLGPAVNLPAWILAPLAVSFVAKGFLAALKYRTGKRIRSSALIADSGNDAVDMVSAVVAAVAVTLNVIDHQRFAYADPVGGLGVALIIFLMGVGIFRRTSQELMDVMPEPALVQQVRGCANTVVGVLKVEKCYGRKSGTQFFFDLHIEVNPQMTVHDAHEVAHQVKDKLLAECDFVRDVLVHVEPYDGMP